MNRTMYNTTPTYLRSQGCGRTGRPFEIRSQAKTIQFPSGTPLALRRPRLQVPLDTSIPPLSLSDSQVQLLLCWGKDGVVHQVVVEQ